jgi:diguanylate cyclase (GGDEF)-like protein
MGPPWRRLIVLSLWLLCLAQPALAQPALRPQLEAIERLPPSRQEQRLQQLEALAVTPGSAEALERLFLIGWTHAQNRRFDALAQLEPRWRDWEKAAAVAERPLAALAQMLVMAHAQLTDGRYREARETYQAPPVRDSLPLLWRLRCATAEGNVQAEFGDLEAALVQHLDALTLAQRTGQDWRHADALYDLAHTQTLLRQHQRAQESMRQLIALLPPDANDADLSRIHTLQAIVLQNAGEPAEALKLMELSLQHARRDGDRRLIALLLANLSYAYLDRQEPQRALTTAEEAHRLALQLGLTSAMSLALHNGGVAKIVLGRLAEGKADVKRSITLELQSGGTTYAAVGWRELGQYLEKAGDLPGAVEAFEAYRQLADGLSRADHRRTLAEAQSRFDVAQRDREEALLKERIQLREAQVRDQRLRFALGAVALASAAALAAALWLLARRLRRNNAQLALTNRELAAQSEVDPLTGLGNRRRLLQLVGRPEAPLQGSLFLIDIDHFKQINDRHGHAGGDAVLQAIAGRLRNALREPLGVMRWGGEEFLLFLRDIDVPLADALAQRLLKEIGGTPVSLRDGRELRVTASIGYALFPLPGSNASFSAERAVDLVDALMYQAKSLGRNQAWGLVGASLDDAKLLRDALTGMGGATSADGLQLRRWPAQEDPA